MKKMKIEKQLIFADHVFKVLALQVSEGLTYKQEEDGIRAIGPLYIVGQYEGDDGVEDFQETLEMDVFAPKDKLVEDTFTLEVANYQADISEDGILLTITLHIHGVKENKNADKQTMQTSKEPVIIPQPSIDEPIQPLATSTIEDVIEEKSAVDDFNDLFSDAESTFTSYRIVVAKPNDSYEAIASRYDVDEIALRNTNKNKEVMAKSLIILPFV